MHSDRRAFLGRGAIGVTAAALAMSGTGRVGAADVPHAFVDVRDFGARGDGATDDTAAIQAAVDTLRSPDRPGGCVLFPSGTYLVSASIVVDYGITLRGVNPAASTIRMSSSVLADMIVGGPSFPVYVHLVDLTLDGGLGTAAAGIVDIGSGTVDVETTRGIGEAVDRLHLARGTCPISAGDVLRSPGQPSVIVTDGEPLAPGAERDVYTCRWLTARALAPGPWQVQRAGSLVRGIGRATIENCRLHGARRHAIELVDTTQGHVVACEIGSNLGAGVFAWSATDLTITRTWSYRNGGPDVYTYAAVDLRIGDCLFEGSASSSVHADWSEVEMRSTGLWGARGSLVHAANSGVVRLSDLKLRDPGHGGDEPGTVASPGFPAVARQPAVYAHFAAAAGGLLMTSSSLQSAGPGSGPLVWVANGTRSNLSGIEWAAGVDFAGPALPRRIIRDDGDGTVIRGCRGVPDRG